MIQVHSPRHTREHAYTHAHTRTHTHTYSHPHTYTHPHTPGISMDTSPLFIHEGIYRQIYSGHVLKSSYIIGGRESSCYFSAYIIATSKWLSVKLNTHTHAPAHTHTRTPTLVHLSINLSYFLDQNISYIIFPFSTRNGNQYWILT